MESWEGLSIYTNDNAAWLKAMNLSTAHWGMGPLPSDLVAISGPFNDSLGLDQSVRVIASTGSDSIGVRPAHEIIFGVISGFAILFTVIWLFFNQNRMLSSSKASQNHQPMQNGNTDGRISTWPSTHDPRTRTRSPPPTVLEMGNLTGFADMGHLQISAELFKEKMNFYYEKVERGLEVYEKNDDEFVDVEDIEAVTRLARKMLELDSEMWGHRSTLNYPHTERERINSVRQMVMNDVIRVASSWPSREGWEPDERTQLTAIMDSLGVGGGEEFLHIARERVPSEWISTSRP